MVLFFPKQDLARHWLCFDLIPSAFALVCPLRTYPPILCSSSSSYQDVCLLSVPPPPPVDSWHSRPWRSEYKNLPAWILSRTGIVPDSVTISRAVLVSSNLDGLAFVWTVSGSVFLKPLHLMRFNLPIPLSLEIVPAFGPSFSVDFFFFLRLQFVLTHQ